MLRGAAAPGREFAALQFTNAATTTCTLAGYPVVTLLLHGKPIGTSSRPASRAPSSSLLAPGGIAESRLDDYTACQAPLSDQIRVVIPGTSRTQVRPAELRACTLQVSALAAPE